MLLYTWLKLRVDPAFKWIASKPYNNIRMHLANSRDRETWSGALLVVWLSMLFIKPKNLVLAVWKSQTTFFPAVIVWPRYFSDLSHSISMLLIEILAGVTLYLLPSFKHEDFFSFTSISKMIPCLQWIHLYGGFLLPGEIFYFEWLKKYLSHCRLEYQGELFFKKKSFLLAGWEPK